MFIRSLTIDSRAGLIRNISFHKGMNFIVDETKSPGVDSKKTGNNIGKTTVLRLINFCLGGSDKSIYQSKEFKNNSNETVKSFLIDQEVVVTLKLQEDLENPTSSQIEIRRNFLNGSKKILEINSKPVKTKDFDDELKRVIFDFTEDKPTFKQIKAKNVRDDAERLENTVRVLGSFGKLEEYEALYLFWLGIDYPDAEKKRQLIEERNIEERINQRLLSENTESKLDQFIKILERDIENLEQCKNNFNINEKYESDLISLNKTRAELNSSYTRQSQLNLRKDLIEESCAELEKELVSSEATLLSELYSQAERFIPSLQKSYEETVNFHNQMINEKMRFVAEEIPSIEAELIKINSHIQFQLNEEKSIVDRLKKSDTVDELQEIVSKLNRKYEDKGRLEEKREQLITSNRELTRIDSALKSINDSIFGLNKLVQSRVSRFNEFFSEISSNLYNEKFAMSASFEQKKNSEQHFYKLYIDSLDGQTGTGKKKGEIAAFDIAYIQFADDIGIQCLHFILHDQIEVIDDNQIEGLVREVTKSNCQFIVPILRDKLPLSLDKPAYQVLSLSQNDKLFGI